MPRIVPGLLDATFYLYHSREDAEQGRNFGGSAFLVSMPSAVPGQLYVAAVTNWHVAVAGGASVLRFNTKDGKTDILEAAPEDWTFDPRYDIAVLPLSFGDPDKHKRAEIPAAAMLKPDSIENFKLGPGEDVFMVGRFIDHDGRNVNQPAVRFGHISTMPAPVVQPNGKTADAFIVDMHSRSGYSGSPVWVYRTPGYDLEERLDPKNQQLLLSGRNLLSLLGIHFGQFPEEWEVRGPDGWPVTLVPQMPSEMIVKGPKVMGMSGMSCVLPAWCIMEVLEMPLLKKQRDANDARLLAEMARDGKAVPVAEVALSEDEMAAAESPGLARALSTPPRPQKPAQ